MARRKNPKVPKLNPYRPTLKINWERVDELLMAGCPGSKIAAALGVCAETLYDRCQQEKSTSFSEYAQQKKQAGDSLIHEVQFRKALGLVDKGDNTLLIWLGKNRLDQKENPNEIVIAPETLERFDAVMNQIRDAQEKKI